MLELRRSKSPRRSTVQKDAASDGAAMRSFRRRNPAKLRAWRVVEAALASGKLKKPGRCSACKRAASGLGRSGLQADHDDYSKPLSIVWLCKPCHNKRQARQNARKAAPKRDVVAPRFDEDEALARRFEHRLRGPFLSAVGILELAADEWTRAVAVGQWNPWLAIDALPWDGFREELFGGAASGLGAVYRRALEKELAENFDLRVPTTKIRDTDPALAEALAFEYIQTQSAALVVAISEATREGMRELLEKLVLENQPPAVTAMRLRKSGLGLTPRMATAVENRRGRLEALGKTRKQIDRDVERYRNKLLRSRALTIARTETTDARNAGIQGAWNVAVSEGELDPLMAKIWLAKVPCPICIELANHPPVPMSKPFMSPTIGPIMRPPAHPRCKCGIGLVDLDRGLGPSAQRMREATQRTDDPTGAAVRATAQAIQAEILAAQRGR